MADRHELAAQATGPLAGVRIVDMTSVVNGSYATQILGDQGADVIKIEDPGSARGGGDTMRWTGKVPTGAPRDLGPIFVTINRNKRSLTLDLREQVSVNSLLGLVGNADVFVSSVRAEGLKRLGLDYDSLRSVKPDLIYVHTSGYGAAGAYGGDPAYDDLVQAASGLSSLYTLVDGDPTPRPVPTLIADKVSGLFVAQAITAALLHRERTGEGQFVEVPMLECVTSFTLVEHLYGHAYCPPVDDWGYWRVTNKWRRPVPTRDGFVAMLPYTDRQWHEFFAIVGWSETIGRDPRFAADAERYEHIDQLYALLDTVTIERTTDEWIAVLRPHSIPVMRVNRLDDLETDPHLASVGFFERYVHPDAGEYLQIRPPVSFGGSPSNIRRHPPRLGEHNSQILIAIAAGEWPDQSDSTTDGTDID